MSDLLILVKRYNRKQARNHPKALFVFGDNMARKGYGGQAKELRGEPNVVGIPTKWRPARDEKAYFTNADLKAALPAIDEAFERLESHLEAGGVVFWPADGVGTGLAQLPTRAPDIHGYITNRFRRLVWLSKGGKREELHDL